ncbi:MAG TPA: sigma-70 family RNA polymerase sigma factor, partial [Chitinophagaceae bacterium]|nr:sigma-70 family RNA polymerase sigma factor [Chitinophagaceae bacterium]
MENLKIILDGCMQNSQREQKKLYEHYYGYCLKIVFRYIYRYEKAVDVVNDGYVKLFRNFSKFQYTQPENMEMILMGWMRTIMVNTAIDYLRKNDFLPEIGVISEHTWQEDK